jgi:hypothetical protein
MKNSTVSLDLIKNSYDAYESQKMITKLFDDKIKFVKLQIFSLEDRYGIGSPFLENRLAELNQSKQDLTSFFEDLEASGMESDEFEIKINCPIQIEVVKKSSVKKQSNRLKVESSWT